MSRILALFLFATGFAAAVQPPHYRPSDAELSALRSRTELLARTIRSLGNSGKSADVLVDIGIYQKAAEWLLRYPEEFDTPVYYKDALAGIERGLARANELARGSHSWTSRKGRLSRGYRSRIDDSVQPYGLVIPESYDPAKPIRLDIVLHGRSPKLTEATFLSAHDLDKPVPPAQAFLQLEVYGRGNNSYFWAGETDVFEALASVRARYNIDPDRIVLRGFSMGGTGAWELGLHHPSMWAAVESGAGYAETRDFVREGVKDPRHVAALTIHNSILCVRNMVNVPWVGYAGELDTQRISIQRAQEELRKLNLEPNALFLTGPNTGHRFHPESKKQSDLFIEQALPRRVPQRFRFACYTPRYGSIWDLHIDTLETMYQLSEITGSMDDLQTTNVSVLTLDRPRAISIDGQRLNGAAFEKTGGKWKTGIAPGLRKRAGLQGPVDDAFHDAFLCVGQSPVFDLFRKEFAKYMRGDVRVKQPQEVTSGDIAKYHLILFGEPWTNPLIAKVLPGLPLKWTRERIELGGAAFPAAGHRVIMIYPNPLNPKRYVVLNSGHTFTGPDGYISASWLLYPRLGDYAVVNDATGAVETFGYFDRNWRLASH